ncbi:MAG TPA: immunoglobulin domain-containing protein [Longimicrobium sp.]|nr:immunoglobulin domain-containing protein [Longimicrobium sp.]
MTFPMRRVVRGGAMLAAAAMCGCLPARPGSMDDGVFTSQGVASIESFRCAQSAVSGMGYTVNWYDGGQETLRAERRYEGSAEAYRGYLTVSVTQENSGRYLFVRGERFTEAGRLPIPSNPSPHPTPGVPRPAARRGSRRVSPGPVAGDARNVVRRCAQGGERSSVTE